MTFVLSNMLQLLKELKKELFVWCHNSESPPARLIRWFDAGKEADQWELEAAFRKGKCKLLYGRMQLHL